MDKANHGSANSRVAQSSNLYQSQLSMRLLAFAFLDIEAGALSSIFAACSRTAESHAYVCDDNH